MTVSNSLGGFLQRKPKLQVQNTNESACACVCVCGCVCGCVPKPAVDCSRPHESLHITLPRIMRITSYRITSHHLASHHLASLSITSPRIASPRIASPRIASPRTASPRITSHHLALHHLASSSRANLQPRANVQPRANLKPRANVQPATWHQPLTPTFNLASNSRANIKLSPSTSRINRETFSLRRSFAAQRKEHNFFAHHSSILPARNKEPSVVRFHSIVWLCVRWEAGVGGGGVR
jgi:hypothetical protein